jgi:hypothetical protein
VVISGVTIVSSSLQIRCLPHDTKGQCGGRSELLSRGPRKRCANDGALTYVLQRCTNLADHGSIGNEGRGPAVRDLSFACVQVALKRLFRRDHLGFM